MDNNILMLGQSPPPYQSIGVGMLKNSSLMGIFPSTPPSTDITTVHMITSFDYEHKGKHVVESTSLSPHEAMYDTIQTFFDVLVSYYWLSNTLFSSIKLIKPHDKLIY